MNEYAFRIRIDGAGRHVYVIAETAIKAMEATAPILDGRSIVAVELLGPTVATMLAWDERAAQRNADRETRARIAERFASADSTQ